MKNKIGRKIIYVLLIVLPLLIGLLASYISKDMMGEYNQMSKPFLSPPAIVFPIVWTILYLLMGVGSLLVYRSNSSESRTLALIFHFVQLIFNFFWSIIFFNAKLYAFAFIWLVLLWLSVAAMLSNYKKVNQTAFILNIPYIVWLTFAAYLNLAVYLMSV